MKLDKYCVSDENYYENTTFISFVVSRKCGGGCWYCHWKGVPEREPVKHNFDKVIEFIDIQGLPNVHFTFYGGEPTESEELLGYMERLNSKYENLQMVLISNMMSPSTVYESMTKFDNLRIIASYHSNLVKNFDEWMGKVDLFKDIHIRLMMTEQNKMVVCNLWEKLKKTHNVHLKPIEQMGLICDMDCDPETPLGDITIIDKDGVQRDDFYLKYRNFKNMICSSGFVITETGDVLRCWEDIVGTIVMNIYKNDLVKLEKNHICTHRVCTCGHRFPKISLRQYGKLYKEQEIRKLQTDGPEED